MKADMLEMGFGAHYMRYDKWDSRSEGRYVRNGIWGAQLFKF
jgi:hypothetical protein